LQYLAFVKENTKQLSPPHLWKSTTPSLHTPGYKTLLHPQREIGNTLSAISTPT